MKPNNPRISIIIPVLNEATSIAKILRYLKSNSSSENIKEIIVVDGGSSDNTVNIAFNQNVSVLHSKKGRAKQMNFGAQNATGEILYFLHVDTLPPRNFDQSIIDTVQLKKEVGCFQMKFDSKSRFLAFFAWFTRINIKLCRGGDQSLFITKKLFAEAKGFNEDYIVFEDNEFINRIYTMTSFTVLTRHVKTSARRYEERGEVALQYHFGMIHLKNYLGAGPEQLYDYYKRKIVS
ncbi:glycosyltransferase [Maribacter algarum]|uniref:Glycosyltransferase n=1 Tax=Maribacter algarum (ex Zhang et al. 2020) TaxID=2578118 RepID=A0A5S3PYU8_9FLAO|nr:TIGR04283 family arsenosugar biosynthesis glycosyltransferase [Maribacter algarum]TMM59462.1 glycosyltransferase [Maribacter algarum]